MNMESKRKSGDRILKSGQALIHIIYEGKKKIIFYLCLLATICKLFSTSSIDPYMEFY
jgi:hypothetical protein